MPISLPATRQWWIYKITSPSGRVYIGITKNINLRKRNYKNFECPKQPILFNSLKKYGWDAHSFAVIDSFTSDSDYALGREMFWIRSFMSCIYAYPDQKGMNSTIGGRGCFGLKMSDSAKNKISEANKGRKVSLDGRKRMSDAKMGVNTYWPSEETKIKMSAARRGFIVSEETKRKISETRKRIGYPSPTKGVKLSECRKRAIGLSKVGNKNGNVAVIAFDAVGKYVNDFDSLKSASKHLGVSESAIQRSCTGATIKPRKYIFKYK